MRRVLRRIKGSKRISIKSDTDSVYRLIEKRQGRKATWDFRESWKYLCYRGNSMCVAKSTLTWVRTASRMSKL